MYSELKVLIVQRVLTKYRFDLLAELSESFVNVGFATSIGQQSGALKLVRPEISPKNVNLHILNSLKFWMKGNSRQTFHCLYPSIITLLKNYDVIVIEGTTNIINNIYLVPIAKLLGKKIIWWDAGSSTGIRSWKRKLLDFVSGSLINLTDAQFAYSTKAKNYIEKYMRAKNCMLLLNTINSTFTTSIKDEINEKLNKTKKDKKSYNLLFVGALEERKNIRWLIDAVVEINDKNHKYTLDVVGGGESFDSLKKYIEDESIEHVNLHGAIYNNNKLKKYYLNADLFVLPGDGGLGIAQALLHGLPVVCVASDGTEEDYISASEFIINDGLLGLKKFLKQFSSKQDVSWVRHSKNKLDHKLFLSDFIKTVNLIIKDST